MPILESKIKELFNKIYNNLVHYFKTKEGEETKTIELNLIKKQNAVVIQNLEKTMINVENVVKKDKI